MNYLSPFDKIKSKRCRLMRTRKKFNLDRHWHSFVTKYNVDELMEQSKEVYVLHKYINIIQNILSNHSYIKKNK